MPTTGGKVFFVGAGPGDPGLLTVRAAEVLASGAPVIADEDAAAGSAGETLVARAGKGETVIRLLAGDPIFSPGAQDEIARVARAGIAFEIVPGLTTATALATFAGIPFNRASDVSPSFAVVWVAGDAELHDWEKLAQATDTLLMITDRASLAEVVRSLVYHGRGGATPAAVVVDVSLPSQVMVVGTLDDIVSSTATIQGNSRLLVVGEAVALEKTFRWFDRRPLFGKRVLVTRTREQSEGLSALLRAHGAVPIAVPAIEIHPPPDPALLARAVERLTRDYDLVAFTSANAVEHFFAELARQGRDARAFAAAKIAAVGTGTAEALALRGVTTDILAKDSKGEGLAEEILANAAALGKKRILLPRALVAREALPEILRAAGCSVDVVPVYETRPPSREALAWLRAELEGGRIDAVTFTSSSTVENLVDALGADAAAFLGQAKSFSIGPVTTATARQRGIQVTATASTHTVSGLISALEASFAAKREH